MVEQKKLIGELTQGRDLATQLNQLDPVQSPEAYQALLEQIVSTYDKALSMLNLRGLKREADQDVHRDVIKKRKTVPQWNDRVRVISGDAGEESRKDDGYSWRKYGQKDILGAVFPRAYYRCTHRNTQGCLATKQVQRSDDDSSMFGITYKGHHTCIQASNSSSTSVPIKKKFPKHNVPQLSEKNTHALMSRVRVPDALCNLQRGLKVETEAMTMTSKEEIFSSICFAPFTQIESAENVGSQSFSKLLEEEHDPLDSHSPAFLSPTTSDSDYFPFDWKVDNYGLNGVLQGSESELTGDVISTPTSATESALGDFDLDFDATTFPIEALTYFS